MKGIRFFVLFAFVAASLVLSACIEEGRLELKYKRNLSTLTMRSGVTGRFFLGSGTIDSNPRYIFAEVGEDGLVAIKTTPYTRGVYKEDVEYGWKPYVEYYWCIGACHHLLPKGLQQYGPSDFYVFHIPRGSVASVYDLGFTQP